MSNSQRDSQSRLFTALHRIEDAFSQAAGSQPVASHSGPSVDDLMALEQRVDSLILQVGKYLPQSKGSHDDG